MEDTKNNDTSTEQRDVSSGKENAVNNKSFFKKPRNILLLISAIALAGIALFLLYAYLVSPSSIRRPRLEHAHFRMQLVVDQKAVNLGEDKYQKPYEKGICSDNLSADPIHLHDNKNQFVHLHWKEISGGLVLKNYGWNFVGGPDNLLGYRLDKLPAVEAVPIFGDVLPSVPAESQFWIYTGSADQYQSRLFEDFLKQNLETFFGTESLINAEEEFSVWDALFPTASAHEGHPHEDELQRINNLLGDVVIFVQASKPSDQQVKDQFSKLEPLSNSVCGG